MSLNTSTLYLHAGLHKTGTTYLQEKVFPLIDNLCCLKTPDFGIVSRNNDKTSLSRFLNSSPLIWDSIGGKLFAKLNSRLGRKSKRERDILISDEHIFRKHTNDPCAAALHLKKMSDKAAEYFFTLKVLIVIRRQDRWFASVYSQVSNEFRCASQSHFEKWLEERIDRKRNFFSSSGIRVNYSYILEELSKYIEPRDIKIIPFELLREEPRVFIEECCKFMGNRTIDYKSIDKEASNKRSTSENTWEIRPWEGRKITLRPSRLFSYIGLNRIKIPSLLRNKEIVLKDEISKKIMSVYEESNKSVNKKVDFNLKKFGYC